MFDLYIYTVLDSYNDTQIHVNFAKPRLHQRQDTKPIVCVSKLRF